ncbi:TIR domain-containing protein [Bartonella queenslandensis]|uniref:TIR domain-containing protein n=1 Tax=Bartonella queenslandensis TaxID=481138 RepID=UPI00030A755B|nr:TIR domain-containing protein [Bartonella queenslandensis]
MKYSGTFEDLKNIVKTAGYKIKETKFLSLNSSGGYQIKTFNGGILNWYENTGTINFQGKENIKQKLIEDLAKHIQETLTNPSLKTASNTSNKEIFIVHGHDHYALKDLEKALLKLELKPYILQNTGGNGLTLIETLKKEICKGSIGFGIVLLTPDDIGYAKSEGKQAEHPRARQNVILEMGMLIAILPFDKIAILYKEGVEIPSDVNGVYYLSFKEHVKETFPHLIERLKKAEVPFNQDAIPRALSSI